MVVLDKAMDLDWASYSLQTTLTTSLKTNVYNTVKFTIKTSIAEKTVIMMSQTANQLSPEDYDYDEGYPVEFEVMNANEYPYLHAQIKASFEGDKDMHDHPQAVYLTLKKEGQIAYSVHADYIP